METILVSYGELALKSQRVRKRLELQLINHIKQILKREGYEDAKVLRRYGRLYVQETDLDAAQKISKVFGVVSTMPAKTTDSELESILDLVIEVASGKIKNNQSFAIRPNVVGEHLYSSRDIAVEAGSIVLETLSHKGIYVDLSRPDITLYIEVRDKDAFVYTDVFSGVGGLPYGTQGKLVSLFSGGIDSPVAAWLMMKRGVELLLLFMDQRPYVGESYIERAKDAYLKIAEYVPRGFNIYSAPIDDIMSRIMESPEPRMRCILCKRSMYRIATFFGKEKGAKGILTGESLGQVASQTLDNLSVIDSATDLPVMRPLIGLDKVEIEKIAREIGTYDITAKKTEGCTVVPKGPHTRAPLEKTLNLEKKLGLDKLSKLAASRIIKNEF